MAWQTACGGRRGKNEGYGVADAQDLTQEFFARVLARDYLARWDQKRGKFRSFLLAFLKHFLLEQRGKSRAQKRGGGWTAVSLDGIQGEEDYLAGLVVDLSPDQIFDRRWAQTIVQRALQRVAAEYTRAGESALFEALKDYHPREAGSLSYAQIGVALGMSEPAVKSAMQRLRQRHREILREEIAQTLSSAGDLEEEIRFLREVMTG